MLQGDVHSLNLATILQDLAADERSGILTLRQAERHLHVWFDGGVIRLVGLPGGRGPSILRGLVAVDALDASELPPPGSSRRQEKALVQRLLRAKRVDEELVRHALVHQMTEHLCEALVWSPADFTFDEGDAADDERFDLSQEAWEVRLPGEALMMEALRRTDEMEETRKALVPATEILVPTGGKPPEGADETTLRLWQEVNGEYSIAELMERTHLGPFAVFKSVGILQAAGCVKSLGLDEVAQRARRHAGRKDWARALRLCEYGLEREPARQELRQVAARCLQALGQDARAVAEYRRLAATHLEESRPEEAWKCFRHILEMVPEDIDAHERCLTLKLTLGDHTGAREALAALTRAAHKAGLPDKVRDASARVLEAIGQDEELIEQLADLQLQLGERKEASRLFQGLLRSALKGGRDEPAIRYARTLQKIHPRSKELKHTLTRLESGEHLRQRIQLRLRKIKLIAAALLAVTLVAAGYEVAARLDLARRRSAILDATVEGRLADALTEYGAFLDRWSLTLVRREVRADRTQLEERYAEQQITEARGLHDAGQAVPAIDQLAAAALRVADEAIGQRLRDQHDAWQRELADQEGALAQEIRALVAAVEDTHDEAAAQALGEITDPLAVPVLRELLGSPVFRIRRRAVESLGQIPTFEAGLGLLRAMTDSDAELREVAGVRLRQHLTLRDAALSLPADPAPSAWDRTLRTAWQAEAPAARVLATLERLPAAAEEPRSLTLGWRITNLWSEPVLLELDAPPGTLVLRDDQGTARPLRPTAPPVGARTILLQPGEYLGGRLCVSLPELDPAPRHQRVEWCAAMTQDGLPGPLEAAPLILVPDAD